MIALTPSPPNASRVKLSALSSAVVASHFESLKAICICVFGRRKSATASLLLLTSRTAWYTGNARDDVESALYPAASVPNMGSRIPKRTTAWCIDIVHVNLGRALCNAGRLLDDASQHVDAPTHRDGSMSGALLDAGAGRQ
eukprot:3142399-Prymnesium_polylepis.4